MAYQTVKFVNVREMLGKWSLIVGDCFDNRVARSSWCHQPGGVWFKLVVSYDMSNMDIIL